MAMYREEDIVYEKGDYWCLRAAKFYEVYKAGITHSVRVASIGFGEPYGMPRVIQEIDRRIANDNQREPTK